jgi:hypothetical protein
MSQSRNRLSTGVLVAIAIALGAVIGAAGIYWDLSSSGNAQSPESLAASSGKACQTGKAALAALRPLARGEVAAMAVRDNPTGLPVLEFRR